MKIRWTSAPASRRRSRQARELTRAATSIPPPSQGGGHQRRRLRPFRRRQPDFEHSSAQRILRRGGKLLAHQLFAAQYADDVGEADLLALADARIAGLAAAFLESGPQIALHAPVFARAERLDPHLLERLEHGARLGPCRRPRLVHGGVVETHPQRHGVRLAAQVRDVRLGHVARRGGQPWWRITPGGSVRPSGAPCGRPVPRWAPQPGTRRRGTGLAGAGAGGP